MLNWRILRNLFFTLQLQLQTVTTITFELIFPPVILELCLTVKIIGLIFSNEFEINAGKHVYNRSNHYDLLEQIQELFGLLYIKE